jgi:hypothetical protein
MKAHEGPVGKKSPFESRVEHEAMVLLAAANRDIRVSKKAKSTMAKDLGHKGRARYLAKLDTSPIESFDSYSAKIQEAIFAAWSGLH